MKDKLIALIISLAFMFLEAWLILIGWNNARELWPELPQASYWQVFWIFTAISLIIKTGSMKIED